MVWFSTLGVEIDDQLLEELRRRANQCRWDCYNAHVACDGNCPRPTLENIEQYQACIAKCGYEYSSCQNHCQVEYEGSIRHYGRPRGLWTPEAWYQEVKGYCGFVAPYFGGAAAALAAAASLLAIPPASPLAAPLGAMAGLLGAEAFYCRLIAVDPVSEDYTQFVTARRLNISDFVSITAENVDFIEDIIRFASHILSTLSFLEAIAGTMDRALYARSIDVEEMYFAQLRSSQGYSRAAAASLRSGQETRLRLVERLDQLRVTEGTGLTLDDQRRDLARQNRMWNALMAAGSNPWNIRPEGREIIISYDGVLEVVERWRTEGIDAQIVNSVNATGISSEGAESIFTSLREWEPTREQFDISIARILEAPNVTGTELGLAEKLDRWANYRGD